MEQQLKQVSLKTGVMLSQFSKCINNTGHSYNSYICAKTTKKCPEFKALNGDCFTDFILHFVPSRECSHKNAPESNHESSKDQTCNPFHILYAFDIQAGPFFRALNSTLQVFHPKDPGLQRQQKIKVQVCDVNITIRLLGIFITWVLVLNKYRKPVDCISKCE